MRSGRYLGAGARVGILLVLLVLASALPARHDVPAGRVGPARPDSFTPSCTIPYDAIRKDNLPIDSQCGLNGQTTNPAASAQNAAKNNLCASGQAVPITISVFDDLQDAAEANDVSFGNQHVSNPEPLPADRSVLRDLVQTASGAAVGEGTKVVYVGFIVRTKTASAESVNCQRTGKAANDLHIVLARRPDETECNSVTAEMIPHFRPEAWDKITFQASVMPKLKKHPVRVTGHMFFDASHSPCSHPEFLPGQDPRRRSNWEIHPVYALDVCKNKTLAGCKVDKETVWKPLHEWVQNPQ